MRFVRGEVGEEDGGSSLGSERAVERGRARSRISAVGLGRSIVNRQA